MMDDRQYLLAGFEPERVLRHFEDICAIPHGSGNEAALARHILALAETNGLFAEQDAAGNVLVRVPASEGCEKAAPLLLQGHMDMVCVKDPGVAHDFEREPVKLILEGNILRAAGTSLGADNAVGLCNMLALMDASDGKHPPLELLFTTEEETGLNGIRRFDFSRLTARRMINMDCGDPDCMVIGSAGNEKYALHRARAEEPFFGTALSVEIYGLRGGHSGIEIGKNRASALDFAGRALAALCDALPARLIMLRCDGAAGGIPRRCSFAFGVPEGVGEEACTILASMDAAFRAEIGKTEPDYSLTVSPTAADRAATVADTRALADLLLLIPYDVSRRSTRNPAWPLCSALLAAADYAQGRFSGSFAIRANLDEYLAACSARLAALCRMTGTAYTLRSSAPAWPDDEASPLQAACREVYETLFGVPMQEEIAHGTVEASVIRHELPLMDIAGFAPKSRGAHTTGEHLYVDTMLPFWRYLTALLARLCEAD